MLVAFLYPRLLHTNFIVPPQQLQLFLELYALLNVVLVNNNTIY